MRTWAEIDGSALRHNLVAIRREVPRGTQIIAVVKSDAYGHGMVRIAKECVTLGVERLGVSTVEEGIELRAAGIRRPILVVTPAQKEEYAEAIKNNLTHTVSSVSEARAIGQVARKNIATVHLQVDTGMGWMGCWHEEAPEAIKKILKLPGVKLEGFYTHFASPSFKLKSMTAQQWDLFKKIRLMFPELFSHAAITHAICQRYAADAVRPGIGLYGAAGGMWRKKLKPILTWKAKVSMVREVPEGRTVGYGATYRTVRRSKLATVAIGYADGFQRLLSNKGQVLIRGKKCPVRGRVAMGQIVVDITGLKNVSVGDEVVLIGRQGGNEISVHDHAYWAQTISYEVLTSIGNRILRVYRNFKTR